MKNSLSMIYVESFVNSFAEKMGDSKVRCIYYFIAIIMCAYYEPKNELFKKENQELKEYLNQLGYDLSTASQLIELSKNKGKSPETKDDFYVQPNVVLQQTKNMVLASKYPEMKAIHFMMTLKNQKFYWLNVKSNQKQQEVKQPIKKEEKLEDKIPFLPAKACILSFYDIKHHLAYRMHLACNGHGLVFGRNKNHDIVFSEKHDDISRTHCKLTCFKNHYYLEDLGSTHGTYVNDILIGDKKNKTKIIELKHNDVIKLADECKIVISLLDISTMKTKKCMSCQNTFYTSNDSDICGICEYEFSKEFGNSLTIQEVDFIPKDFSGINKVFNKKVETFDSNVCQLIFNEKVVVQEQPKIEVPKKEEPKKNVKPEKKENEIIPGYEKIKLIGEGGMGKVYLVKEVSTGKLMALKTVKEDPEINEIMKERFKREASIQEQMNHKYIAKLYGHGEYNGMLYILMEYYKEGTILDYFIKNKSTIKVNTKLKELLIQILQGLDYLHHASVKAKLANGEIVQVDGVIHRDIKPQNIFISYDAYGNPMVKIADFGLSKAFEIAGKSGFSKTGNIMGTFTFMPRQQLIYTKYAKAEVDIWAAVAIVYYLATGQFPKTFSNDKDPILTCVEDNPIPIRNRNWLFPAKFAKIIDQALYDNCDHLYYQEAEDLIHDLMKL